MEYDLFISYARRDNAGGRVTELVNRIREDFAAFANRELNPFFDVNEIGGMEDWRHRILRGLRESRLMLACLSPAYLDSGYCEWEFTEYVKYETGRPYMGEGVAPIYDIWAVLTQAGYDGYAHFEWERGWHPEVEHGATAVPHFAAFMAARS